MNILEAVCREVCKTRGMDPDMWHLFVDRVKDHIDIHAAMMRVNLGAITSLKPRGDESESTDALD